MLKKKILFHSDFSLLRTGFGRNARALLTHLYKTGKYDLYHYCNLQIGHPELSRTCWKSIGCLPNNLQEINQLNQNPNLARLAAYGGLHIDNVINEVKPDVYIGIQDFWGVNFSVDKPWFNKITSAIWTTLDSLPLLPEAVEKAPKISNYFVWSSFAEKEMIRLGFNHVKTLHGAIDDKYFYRLSDNKRDELRKKFNIPKDSFVIGSIFRNQLRKLVPNLLDGYSMWRKQNPHIKNTYIFLHTSLSEGWQIYKLAAEYGINPKEILVTYICKNCKSYHVMSFTKQDIDCPYCKVCGSPPTQQNPNGTGMITVNIQLGVTEVELNELYNLMDLGIFVFTSGGQEIPVQECKLTETITLVTNYSCGEELCEEGSGSLPLEWAEYREISTEFRKASTYPSSIAKQLNKVYLMDKSKRLEMGRQGRKWVLDGFSVNVIGKRLEEFFDKSPIINWQEINLKAEIKNPNYIPPPTDDDREWLRSLYSGCLNMSVDTGESGYEHWYKVLGH